jgi:Helix-turn-helix domain
MKSKIPFIMVPSDAALDQKLSNAALRTLLIICMHCNRHTGSAFPSYNTIAKEHGTHRTNIIKYVKDLCELGYVRKEPNVRKNGRSSSNIYYLNYTLSTLISDGRQDTYPAPKVPYLPSSRRNTYPLNTNTTSLTRKNNNNKKTLEIWEKEVGSVLSTKHLMAWIKENHFEDRIIKKLLTEFRERVIAGGNEYSDFSAAFKIWLKSGYLSMSWERAHTSSQASSGAAVYAPPGVTL